MTGTACPESKERVRVHYIYCPRPAPHWRPSLFHSASDNLAWASCVYNQGVVDYDSQDPSCFDDARCTIDHVPCMQRARVVSNLRLAQSRTQPYSIDSRTDCHFAIRPETDRYRARREASTTRPHTYTYVRVLHLLALQPTCTGRRVAD